MRELTHDLPSSRLLQNAKFLLAHCAPSETIMTLRLAAPAALVLSASLLASPCALAGDAFTEGTRSGPFVVTKRSLTELAKDGYEIRGNLGTALVLQKKDSIYSCMIPPDPEHLSYQPRFVCSELQEETSENTAAPAQSGRTPGTH